VHRNVRFASESGHKSEQPGMSAMCHKQTSDKSKLANILQALAPILSPLILQLLFAKAPFDQ
jgi:hypothetical protein